MTYLAFGRVLASDLELPELPRASGASPPHLVIRRCARVEPPRDVRWTPVWEAGDDGSGVWYARYGSDVFLKYDGLAHVRVAGSVIELASDADAEPLRHVLLDQLLPLALASAGEIVLHASAVEVDEAALVFTGEARSGKSTLAAALAAAGARVLADDAVLMDARGAEVWAVPSYPGLRLWPDAVEHFGALEYGVSSWTAGSSKRRFVVASGDPAAPRRVAAAYVLRRATSGAGVAPISRRDAAVELVRHAFTPDVASRDARREQVDRAVRAAARLDLWTLDIDRDLSRVDAVARHVLAHARASRNAP